MHEIFLFDSCNDMQWIFRDFERLDKFTPVPLLWFREQIEVKCSWQLRSCWEASDVQTPSRQDLEMSRTKCYLKEPIQALMEETDDKSLAVLRQEWRHARELVCHWSQSNIVRRSGVTSCWPWRGNGRKCDTCGLKKQKTPIHFLWPDFKIFAQKRTTQLKRGKQQQLYGFFLT